MGAKLPQIKTTPRWGLPPWTVDFHSEQHPPPQETDFAVVGGGFTGLAAAAWLRHLAPQKSVTLFEASRIGACSSRHTGGMALSETAAGNLPGLGDVLSGFSNILRDLQVDCDLTLPGALEIGRSGVLPSSPVGWNDCGTLGVTREVPGGTVDPGKMLSSLAQAATKRGTLILENAPVENLSVEESLVLQINGSHWACRPCGAEIHISRRDRASIAGADFIARPFLRQAVLHRRPAIPVGSYAPRKPRDFRERLGASGGLARTTDA